MGSLLPGRGVRGKIIVTGERAECPVCHRSLPGVFPPGSTADGILLACKRCRQEFEICKLSDLRPERPASSD